MNAFSSTEMENPAYTILLVDDSPVNVGVVVESLERDNFEVLVALDGEEALRRAEMVLPDLILLDVMMPGMDGFEVCRRLKACPATGDIPVIFMTSLGGVRDKVAGFSLGAVDYITKPLQIDELKARVGTHLKLRTLQRQLAANNENLRQEIAEREQTEALLRKREEEFRALAENSIDPIYRYGRDCRRIYVNPAVERISGQAASSLLGKTPVEARLAPPEESARVLQSIQRVLETGRAEDIDVKFVAPDGRELYFQNRHVPEFGPDGGVASVLSLGRDITERKQHETALLEKAAVEARLSKLAATAPGVVILFRREKDGGFTIPYAAPGIVDICGLRPERLAQDASVVAERLHPDDRARVMESLAESARTLSAWRCECRVQNPARGELWIESHAIPELGPDGEILWYGFVHDITSRKLAQRRYEMVNFALDNVEEAAFLVEGVWIVHANSGACTFLGYSAEELKGMTVFDFVPDFDGELLEAVLGELKEKGRSVFETRYRSKEGVVFPVDVSATGFTYEGREMRLFLARDVTERKRVEALLQRREQEFRALVENSPDTIARYDRDCRRIYANPSLESSLGARNALGKTPLESAGLPAYYQEALKEVLETGREGEFKLNWRTADGTDTWTHIRLIPEVGSDGSTVSVLAMGRDITDLVETERHLKESRALLRNLARRREAEYEAERKRVAWEVYDTLGQLLMVQRMDVSLLRARFPGETAALSQHLDKMLGTTDKAIQVMRNVAYELRPVTLDMGVVFGLEWLVAEFRKNTGLFCELLVGEEEIRLDETDANMLFRIVEESLDNVARHAEAGRVQIELSRKGGDYLLEIRDDGKGFDLNIPMEKSMGLLGIQERVHALGGEMVLLSILGGGTVVEVRIPVQEEVAGQLDLWREDGVNP